jgi:hypothetical protein
MNKGFHPKRRENMQKKGILRSQKSLKKKLIIISQIPRIPVKPLKIQN